MVFMAEQMEPVQRKVALKVIKAGMDTREVNARFEAERQALALMDHPNIAQVLDGGATTSGRPYFVMELVRGIPITEFRRFVCRGFVWWRIWPANPRQKRDDLHLRRFYRGQRAKSPGRCPA